MGSARTLETIFVQTSSKASSSLLHQLVISICSNGRHKNYEQQQLPFGFGGVYWLLPVTHICCNPSARWLRIVLGWVLTCTDDPSTSCFCCIFFVTFNSLALECKNRKFHFNEGRTYIKEPCTRHQKHMQIHFHFHFHFDIQQPANNSAAG